MAKYDWKQLKKEYILGDFRSVEAFLKFKSINRNGSTKKRTKGWKKEKAQKEEEKSKKIIEKTIEREAEKEARKIADVQDIANNLAHKLEKATEELEKYIIKSKGKTKNVTYDLITQKPKTEIIEENENISIVNGIIDTKKLKELSSSLKDLNDILNNKEDDNQTKEVKVTFLDSNMKEWGN